MDMDEITKGGKKCERSISSDATKTWKKKKTTFSSNRVCMSVWMLSLLVDMSTPVKLEINVCMLGQFTIHNVAREGSSIAFPAKLQKLESFGRSLSLSVCRLGNKVFPFVSSSMTIIASKTAQFLISNSSSFTRSKATDGVNTYVKLQHLSSTTSDFKLLK